MQVLKVMNNSLVLALDEAGTECILMGKGIGYNKAIGHEIQDDEIEKVFILTDNKMLTNFVQLASTLDDTYINLVKKIIDHAATSYQIESILVCLCGAWNRRPKRFPRPHPAPSPMP